LRFNLFARPSQKGFSLQSLTQITTGRGCFIMKNKVLHYNPSLKVLAQKLRQQGILSEVLLWKKIKNKSLGIEFHRQVLIDNYIVDFYCHELMLTIEIHCNSHHIEEITINDIHRQEKLENLGVHFIRFEDLQVKKNMNNVIRCLMIKIEERQSENS
jgi:very-short-patch-repair endonuclease